jgi:hypothetical protein
MSFIGTHAAGNHLLINHRNGNFTIFVLPGGDKSMLSVAVADFDQNGSLDIIVGNANGEQNLLLPNDGEWGFIVHTLPGGNQSTVSISVGYIDEDSNIDVLIGNYGQVKILLNHGELNFTVLSLPGAIKTQLL